MPASAFQPQWQLQQAKARFSHLVDAALEGTPQHVTRHGKPAVVVLAEDDYRALRARVGTPKRGFAQHLLDIPKERRRRRADPDARIVLRDVSF